MVGEEIVEPPLWRSGRRRRESPELLQEADVGREGGEEVVGDVEVAEVEEAEDGVGYGLQPVVGQVEGDEVREGEREGGRQLLQQVEGQVEAGVEADPGGEEVGDGGEEAGEGGALLVPRVQLPRHLGGLYNGRLWCGLYLM